MLRGKEQLVRHTPTCRRDLKEQRFDYYGWIHLAQQRVQWQVHKNMAMSFQVP
jgi:hypothetical protein